MVRALAAALPDMELVLHLHDTRGFSLANVMTGLAAGVRRYESSLGGVGGCPFAPGATGNVATEDLVHFLHAEGYETGYDLAQLVIHGKHLSALLGRPLPGKLLNVPPVGFTIPFENAKRAVG